MVVGLFQVLSLNIPDHKVKRGKEMISNLVLQDTINGIKNIGRCELTIVDLEGKVVASTEEENNINRSDIVSFAESQADSQEIKGSMYFKVYDDYQVEYVVIVRGNEDMTMIGKLAAFQIQNLVIAYKEHFDKDNFIKNLLLDNLLLVDVYNRAMKLHIATNVKRVVYILNGLNKMFESSLKHNAVTRESFSRFCDKDPDRVDLSRLIPLIPYIRR